jgi:hypothetical protein
LFGAYTIPLGEITDDETGHVLDIGDRRAEGVAVEWGAMQRLAWSTS